MPEGQSEPKHVVHRCKACGHLVEDPAVSAESPCPQCGEKSLVRAEVSEDALGYAAADRRAGPSIEDGRLGRMAYFAGWMTLDQVAKCLRLQWRAIKKGRAYRFGEVAVRLNFLTREQVSALLRLQAIRQPTPDEQAFGALAVQLGLVTQEQLDEALAEQARMLESQHEAPLLGMLLVEKRLLLSEQVKQVLAIQAEAGQGALAGLRPDDLRPGGERADGSEDIFEEETVGVTLEEAEQEAALAAVCRCADCGRTMVADEWKPGSACPACGSTQFAPVPEAEEGAVVPEGPDLLDHRFGRMAYFAGWMTPGQVSECLRLQKEAREQGAEARKLGEIAVAQGFLTEAQSRALLHIQSIHHPVHHDETFGAIAVRHGFITQQQLDQCLAAQKRLLEEKREAPLLGLLMEERGLLSQVQVKAILTLQAKHRQGPLPALEEATKEPPGAVAAALRKTGLGEAWPLFISVPVLVLSLVFIASQVLGGASWQSPEVVVGCKNCQAVMRVPADFGVKCPQCRADRGLAPIARCKKCGHLFLFGALYAGTRCPGCGASEHEAVKDLAQASRDWRLPPRRLPVKAVVRPPRPGK
jgi:predicted  nucleic acid-binding Zn-ribbon protein